MSYSDQELVILLGDVDESLARTAFSMDPAARLLDHSNYKQFLTSEQETNRVYYTSLGDLPKDLDVVYRLLSRAGRVIYCPPKKWSDGRALDCINPGNSMQGLTEVLLCMLPRSVRVENFHPMMQDPIGLVDIRRSELPQLWSVGCSITYGRGVTGSQRYGQLLSQLLDMPCSFLAEPGRSIDWAADQVLRSDVKADDLVVWGLTNPERLTYVHQHQLMHGITIQAYDQFSHYKDIVDPKNLISHNNLYKQYYAIQQVINFCRQIGANLILINLLFGNHLIQRAFYNHENYICVPYKIDFKHRSLLITFADLGADNQHPGPLQHQQYCQLVYDHISKNARLKKLYIKTTDSAH